QMADARGNQVSVRIAAQTAANEEVEFSASGRTITFHGFLKAYVEATEGPDAVGDDQQTKLPNLAEGEMLTPAELAAVGHQTKPPARYTEASLIKELEER